MWDNVFMADMDNLTDINENFDTIKTLLNSIRAQGILNTSDVDKLLSGINAKLEKINTDEDIDIIKVFLTELKQNLDERHNVLISKFGAIEALFSNLLKNSNELPKSSELKELFDIVATNLSVFSREVVAQKESLTDITLRLDAIRSDDSQKKDIIKNITLLKPDLDRLNNGFDTIVLSLNDNFKTLAKTISSIDQTEHLNKFADNLNSIEMSSNALLSALQLLDKKTEAMDNSIKGLVTKSELELTNQGITDLRMLNQGLNDTVIEINRNYSKIDTLTEKIDASVNIIVNLKTMLEDADSQTAKTIVEGLDKLSLKLSEVDTEGKFEEFKTLLTSVIKELSDSSAALEQNMNLTSEKISSIIEGLKALDINTNFSSVLTAIEAGEAKIKNHFDDKVQSFTTLSEANLSKILDNISTNADSLNTRLNQAQSLISSICEGSFNTVFENVADLKKIIAQLDENGVSANNAMFANISDRLNLFESTLKQSLEAQESTTNDASEKLREQVENIKNLSSVLDYKMDSSVVEISNMTRMFDTLKASVDNVLALNFVETVKDLRADIYASKQDLAVTVETSGNSLTESLTNDLYGKYELIISKLDSVEDEFKKTQASSLNSIKEITEKISASIMDVISYVSESKEFPLEEIDKKIEGISTVIKETNLNYVESVRDIVDIIRVQVENNLNQLEEESGKRFVNITGNIDLKAKQIQNDIKNSYDKLTEVQKLYGELKEQMNINSVNNNSQFDKLLTDVTGINTELDGKFNLLKTALLDRISEFKNEFACDNANRINEFKYTFESLSNKNSQNIVELLDNLKIQLGNVATESGTARTSGLNDIMTNFKNLETVINNLSSDASNVRTDALKRIYDNFENLKTQISAFSTETADTRKNALDKIFDGFENLKTLISTTSLEASSTRIKALDKIYDNFEIIKTMISNISSETSNNRTDALDKIYDNFENLKAMISNISTESSNNRTDALDKISDNFESLKTILTNISTETSNTRTDALEKIYKNFESIKNSIKTLSDESYEGRKSGLQEITGSLDEVKEQLNTFADEVKTQDDETLKQLSENYTNLKQQLEKLSYDSSGERTNALAKLLENFVGLKEYTQTLNTKTSEELTQKTNTIIECFDSVKTILNKVDENVDGDMTRQLSIIESNFESLISQMTILSEKTGQTLVDKINSEYNNIAERIDANVTRKLEEYKIKIEDSFDDLSAKAQSQSSYLQERIADINSALKTVWAEQSEQNIQQIDEISDKLREILNENVEKNSVDYASLKDRLDEFTHDLSVNNEVLTQNLKAQLDDMTKYIDSVLDIQTQEADAHIDEFAKLIESLNEKLFKKTDEIKTIYDNQLDVSNTIKEDVNNLNQANEKTINSITDLTQSVKDLSEETVKNINDHINEVSELELKAISDSTEKLVEQLETSINSVIAVKDFISNAIQSKLKAISGDIEKETDIVIKELSEQFELVRKAQQDSAIQITSGIESIVENQIYNNIEDLKSYLDVKTDTSVLTDKFDNLKSEITTTFENVISDLNKMLNADVFTTAISDYRAANEILINSATDRINEKITSFIGEASKSLSDDLGEGYKNIENKLALFDKNFVDALVDKYEEIKLLSNKYNSSFDEIKKTTDELTKDFLNVRADIESKIDSLTETIKTTSESTNQEIRQLNDCFENLRAQISNKSFDEAFQASINKQIASLESLIKDQLTSIEDISDLCEINLPDVAELNTLVKGSVIESLKSLTSKVDEVDEKCSNADAIQDALKDTKAEIITQFINIFNQISFVAEQEEILDYIQERHDNLITILSHIVSTTSEISVVKDEIKHINEKINSIISSDGDIDYIYSLQDLESDIANLRVILKDMQDDNSNYSSEVGKLIDSTENVYKLVESIKDELPDKKSFESLTEDIVSISTRTNKLILASDESYKTLQDNLHDFKLVIDDLDERTRNFAQESGMDRIDSKLNALNTMVQNGAKTNQVFNQVFEYLAEWIDNAGTQINSISDKIETLDDIGQIKVMLADLKAEAEDNSENVELVEALGNVFDKQAKKISSMETKIDKLIVENTINSQKNKLDLKPMEDTLNKFLAAIGDKISSQQEQINSLESTLEKILAQMEEKDTAQLTKKVGGMDKQIAKLNKSIEKIVSNAAGK